VSSFWPNGATRSSACDFILGVSLERIHLDRESWIDYDGQWLDPVEQVRLHARLVDELEWHARPINVYGRSILQPRLIAWAGGLPYRYSGQTLAPQPWPPALLELLERLVRETGVLYNHALLNRYRDGNDHMGRHADDEPELGRDPTIAAVSLGTPRRFLVEAKSKRYRKKRTIWMEPGSLMVMGGRMQHRFRHAVPKQARLAEERINVTFRFLTRLPPRRFWPPREEAGR
jgi:alkylated DNA repair dioxygenase AlkB